MQCPRCGSTLATIDLTDGEDAVTMGSCAPCNRRYWCRGSRVVDLREALAAVPPSTHRRSGSGGGATDRTDR